MSFINKDIQIYLLTYLLTYLLICLETYAGNSYMALIILNLRQSCHIVNNSR